MNCQQFITILIISFIVLIAWLLFDFLHTKASVQVETNVQDLLDPVNPDFDKDTLNKIKEIKNPLQVGTQSGQQR